MVLEWIRTGNQIKKCSWGHWESQHLNFNTGWTLDPQNNTRNHSRICGLLQSLTKAYLKYPSFQLILISVSFIKSNRCQKVCSSKTKQSVTIWCPLSLCDKCWALFYCPCVLWPCHYVLFGCGFGESMRVVRCCLSQGLSPCPHPCKGVLRPATVPIISHPSIANDQTPAGCRVIIIMTKRARRAKRPAEGERGNEDGKRKKERKSKWVWSIVNFTKSLRCVSGVNKWINLSVGLWSVTPYCCVPSGARPSNLSYLFSLLHTHWLLYTSRHTHSI